MTTEKKSQEILKLAFETYKDYLYYKKQLADLAAWEDAGISVDDRAVAQLMRETKAESKAYFTAWKIMNDEQDDIMKWKDAMHILLKNGCFA